MRNSPEVSAERTRPSIRKVGGALGITATLAACLYGLTSSSVEHEVHPAAHTTPTPNPSLEFLPGPSPESSPELSQEPSTEAPLETTGEFTTYPTWSQEFSTMRTTTLDTSVWRYDLNPNVPGYNKESQAYTNSQNNVRIEPGVGLVIEAHHESYQYPGDPQKRSYEFTSGRIDTIESFTFEYGKVEARMKLPEGEGVWPAFWLLSGNEIHTETKTFTDKERRADRFYLQNGEIDIMEYYGNNPGVVEGTVHTFADSQARSIQVPDASEAFHTYGVEVTPQGISWTLDGEEYYSVEKPSDNTEEWPFGHNNHLFVLLNLAIGGPAGAVNPEDSSWRMEVEHVRFYQYAGTGK